MFGKCFIREKSFPRAGFLGNPSEHEDEAQYKRLSDRLATIGCTTLKPIIGTRDLELADISNKGTWRKS